MVPFALVLQARFVVSISFFKCCCYRANVSHGRASTLHGNSCLIDHTSGKALSFQRAYFFSSSAVTTFLSLQILHGCRGAQAGVVVFDECSHVGWAAVADVHCAAFEDFVQLAAHWEVLGDQMQETFSDVCFHILVVRGDCSM